MTDPASPILTRTVTVGQVAGNGADDFGFRRDYLYDVDAIDPDNDALTYTLSQGPQGASMDADGHLNWFPSAAGSYPFEKQVADGRGGVDTQSFTLIVGDGTPNVALENTARPVTVAVQNLPYAYNVRTFDANLDPTTFALDHAPAGMTIDANTGVIARRPTALGSTTFTVIARGAGGLTDTHDVTVETRAQAAKAAPVFDSQPPTRVIAGETYFYQPSVSDPDGDPIMSYALLTRPDGMAPQGAHGHLTWTPTPAQLGACDVALRATERRGASMTQTFRLEVVAGNNSDPENHVLVARRRPDAGCGVPLPSHGRRRRRRPGSRSR